MSGNWPPPGSGDGAAAPPVVPGGQPSGEPQKPRGRGLGILVLVVAIVVVLCGGAFAVYKTDPFGMFRSGPQASQAVPADALAYAGLDLDPSAEQKINAVRFLNHFPAFKQNSGLEDADDDIRKAVLEQFIDETGCANLTYQSDIEPWLGKKFGVAAMPSGSGDAGQPVPLFAIQVTDTGAAKDGLAKISDCAEHHGSTMDYAFTDDYVLITQKPGSAESFANAAEKSSLADNDAFSADIDSLGQRGVVTMWADVQGLIDEYASQASAAAPSDVDMQQLKGLSKQASRVAATIRFSSDHADLVLSARGQHPEVQVDNPVAKLPDSTVFALSWSGLGERVSEVWDEFMKQAGAEGSDIKTQVERLQAMTGLTLPQDLKTLLGKNLLFALDATSLAPGALQQGIKGVNAGVRITGDADKIEEVYHKLLKAAGDQAAAFPLVEKRFDDGVAIATNNSYADELGSLDGSLGDTDAFKSVIDDPQEAEFVGFFNFDKVEDRLFGLFGSDQSEVVDNLRPLRSIGLTIDAGGTYSKVTLSVSVND